MLSAGSWWTARRGDGVDRERPDVRATASLEITVNIPCCCRTAPACWARPALC